MIYAIRAGMGSIETSINPTFVTFRRSLGVYDSRSRPSVGNRSVIKKRILLNFHPYEGISEGHMTRASGPVKSAKVSGDYGKFCSRHA